MHIWQMQEAKAQLAEVVRHANEEGRRQSPFTIALRQS